MGFWARGCSFFRINSQCIEIVVANEFIMIAWLSLKVQDTNLEITFKLIYVSSYDY